jgi:hypothetical protein
MNVGSTMYIAQKMKRDTIKFCIISIMAIILVSSLDCMQATREVEVCLIVCLAEKSTSIAMVDRVRKQDSQLSEKAV